MKPYLRHHIEKLELFVAVAKAGSFRSAADRIGISQPSISHAIQVLEDAVGKKLFDRFQRGVELTPEGNELLKFSERLLVEVEGVESRIKNPGNALIGALNVGTFSSFITYLWPKFLKDISAGEGRGIRVQLHSIRDSEVESSLSSRKYHLLVTSEFVRLQNAINVELYRDSYGFFYSKKLDKSQEELSGKPLIYVPEARDSNGNSLERILMQEGISDERSYRLDTFDSVISLVKEGLGLAVLPLKVAASSGLHRVCSKGPYSRDYGEHIIYCSLLSSDRTDPRTALVLNQLKKWCAKI